jgi:hypothetical protein
VLIERALSEPVLMITGIVMICPVTGGVDREGEQLGESDDGGLTPVREDSPVLGARMAAATDLVRPGGHRSGAPRAGCVSLHAGMVQKTFAQSQGNVCVGSKSETVTGNSAEGSTKECRESATHRRWW